MIRKPSKLRRPRQRAALRRERLELEPLETRLAPTVLPTGFTENLLVSGLADPTALEFAPDGRLFVTEQGGKLRVVKDGALVATPFLSVDVDTYGGERGLL